MESKKYEINMTQGSILKSIALFVIPLIIGNMLQLLYNAADLVVVSRFAGSSAMASVGATGALSALIVNLCVGFSLGASVVVSRSFGAGDEEGVSNAVHTAMVLSIILGVFSLVCGISCSKVMLTLMGTPEGKVLDGAVLYMRIYFLGIPGTMVYNFGASILRAVGDTRRPLYILSLSGIINVLLNLVLVILFHLNVAGVAIATGVANYVSAIAVTVLLIRNNTACKLCLGKLKIHKQELKETVKIGLPAGLQSSVFSLSNSVIQSAVNSFGEIAVAGNAAAGNIEGFVYVAMNSVSQATITGVSQNNGAQKPDRVKRTVSISALLVTVLGLVLGGLCILFSDSLLKIYITDSPDAVAFGRLRILCVCLPYFLCGLMDVLAGALRGIGCSVVPMINSLIGACGLRVVWMWLVLPHFRSPQMLYYVWPISWVAVIVMHLVCVAVMKKRGMDTPF